MQTYLFYTTFALTRTRQASQRCSNVRVVFFIQDRWLQLFHLAKVIRNPQEPDYDLIYEKQKKCIVGIVAHVFDAHSCWGTGCRF